MTEPEPLQFIGTNEVRFRGRQFTYYSGCDFLRLARDPRLAAAASKTLVQHGLTVAASRITTGNHQLYTQLETALATFFDAPTALLLPDGYLAPMAVAQALAGEFTHAFIDELAHGALADAARMLVDYLASAETEIALAKAKSRQIPLGPVDAEQLPEEVRKLTDWSREGIDLRSLLPDRRECLKWLQDEYLK